MAQPDARDTSPLPEVGARATRTRGFTSEDVGRFADLVGDHNPIHLDAAYAERSPFGRPIVHGMLTASLLSAILGEELPGPGCIYLSQSLRFEAPVYVGDTLTASVEVIAARSEKRILTLRTLCVRQDGAVAIAGEAIVKWLPLPHAR